MKNPLCKRVGTITLALAISLAGCRSESDRSAPQVTANNADAVDLDAVMTKALEDQRPVLVLIFESGHNAADNDARAVGEKSIARTSRTLGTSVLLDLSVSRNRATAARFHVTDTPMLVCLSPRGVIVNRDVQPITNDLLLKRMNDALNMAPALDAQLALLEEAAASHANQAAAKLNLADFLLAHQNAREAIGPLASVAHSDAVEPATRVSAWVALIRAHFWITEPEKGRHEAKDLMTTLGPTTPEALAGGNLMLGVQDANAKRISLARREFEEAIAAAPDSTYAKQAADAVAKLPEEGK